MATWFKARLSWSMVGTAEMDLAISPPFLRPLCPRMWRLS